MRCGFVVLLVSTVDKILTDIPRVACRACCCPNATCSMSRLGLLRIDAWAVGYAMVLCACYTRMQAISKDSYLGRTFITTSGHRQISFSRIRLVALMRISIQLWFFFGLREFASKKHLDRLVRFCTVCRCAHNTDIQTTGRATYCIA